MSTSFAGGAYHLFLGGNIWLKTPLQPCAKSGKAAQRKLFAARHFAAIV
jgi:hypothetical protein